MYISLGVNVPSVNTLISSEESQLKVIEGYLPAQLAGDALHAAVHAVLKAQGFSSPGDLGKAIGACRTALAGQVDGKVSADAVKALLTA